MFRFIFYVCTSRGFVVVVVVVVLILFWGGGGCLFLSAVFVSCCIHSVFNSLKMYCFACEKIKVKCGFCFSLAQIPLQ